MITINYSGKYRGAAHNACNLRYKTPKKIIVVFHNGSKYDYHFLIKYSQKNWKDSLDTYKRDRNNFSANNERTWKW